MSESDDEIEDIMTDWDVCAEHMKNSVGIQKLANLMDESFNYRLNFNEMEWNELIEFTGDFLFGNTEYKCENENADIIQIKELYFKIRGS